MLEDEVITREELSNLLMLTPRRINQLVNEGVIPKHKHGKYPLLQSLHGYFSYLGAEDISNQACPFCKV